MESASVREESRDLLRAVHSRLLVADHFPEHMGGLAGSGKGAEGCDGAERCCVKRLARDKATLIPVFVIHWQKLVLMRFRGGEGETICVRVYESDIVPR